MATIIDVPFVGPSYHMKDWAVDCQRTLNLYPQTVESGNAPQVSALLPTPGLIAKYELSGPVRGLYTLSEGMLAVVGNKLFLLKNEALEIGNVYGNNLVKFADNRIDVLIIGEPDTYIFNLDSKS